MQFHAYRLLFVCRIQDLVALAVRLGGHQLLRKVIHAVGRVFLYAAHVLGQDLRHAKAHINRRAQIQRAAAQVERILRQGGVVGADYAVLVNVEGGVHFGAAILIGAQNL